MAICPATLEGCIDDMCYGNGCMRMDGEPMLERCSGGCGAFIPINGSSDVFECECDDGFEDDWDEEDDE